MLAGQSTDRNRLAISNIAADPIKAMRDLEKRTRGLVCGPAIYSTDHVAISPVFRDGKDYIVCEPQLLPSWQATSCFSKIEIKSRATGATLWLRPLHEKNAALVWGKLFESRLGTLTWRCPSIWTDDNLIYEFAVVQTFNTTPGGGTSPIPAFCYQAQYLSVAGGAAGGSGNSGGGGGGAGGLLTGSVSTTPGINVTVTVGSGGSPGSTSNPGGAGNPGTNSVFISNTALGGGGGASGGGAAGSGSGTVGSGGGGWNGTFSTGGTGTPGQGSNGGNATAVGFAGAGGGGASAVGGDAAVGPVGGAGGAGNSSSITGSIVNYAGGGGGGGGSGGGTAGVGGLGGGGAGSNSIGGGAGFAGTTNTGGGGGGGNNGFAAGGAGGTGFVAFSYNPLFPPPKRTINYISRGF